MHKKYIPKYRRTWNEYDSDDTFKLLNNIRRYQEMEDLKKTIKNIVIGTILAIIAIILSKGG